MAYREKAVPVNRGVNLAVIGGTIDETAVKLEKTIWIPDATIGHWDISSVQPLMISGNKNLIILPKQEVAENSGVTYQYRDTGAVALEGTATDKITLTINSTLLSPGMYTFSGGGIGSDTTYYFQIVDDAENILCSNTTSSVSFLISEETTVFIKCVVFAGAVMSHTFHIQLEKGAVATEFIAGSADNQIWIQTGNVTDTPLNVGQMDKRIEIKPIAVYQVKDGAWVTVEGKIYQNGTWVPISGYPFKTSTTAAYTETKSNLLKNSLVVTSDILPAGLYTVSILTGGGSTTTSSNIQYNLGGNAGMISGVDAVTAMGGMFLVRLNSSKSITVTKSATSTTGTTYHGMKVHVYPVE